MAGLQVRLRQRAPIPLDAELSCAPGELLALVGPSGSGKTTILRAVAGLNRVEDGSVRCDGTAWSDSARRIDLPPQARRVGLVFQDYALFPHMTAEANVAAALGHLPASARAARARALLALVHLDGLEARRPAALSGGQRQRVAIARALARDPAVLLLDEPYAAVDQVTRRKLQRELAQLRRTIKMPIVLVTHDLDEAAALADRMCILHRGRTLQTGAPYAVMTRPADPLVARLVGLRNLFEGDVVGHDVAEGITRLRWRAHVLDAGHQPGFRPGARVSWLVPQAGVILHRRDRPSRGERENPLRGRIAEFVVLGDTAQIVMAVDDRDDCLLSFAVPTHVARRNGLAAGTAIGASLLADAIHLMPPQAVADAP
jgi:molybdate transport system ATP-binding protein